MSRNLGKLFYKDYYNGVDFSYALRGNDPSFGSKENIERVNQALLGSRLPSPEEMDRLIGPIRTMADGATFRLKVVYPGLVTGIGLVHDSKKLDGAFNLGMHFNYTYGVPVIYGSSIKGILRSYFTAFYEGQEKERMLADIFDGENNGKAKPQKERDVFFDAVLVSGDASGRIFETDAITPHREGPLNEPNPVTFLKIAAGATIEFFFRLTDSEVNGEILNKKDKLELFRKILMRVGAGAKTNVGYGQFENER